MGEIYNIMWKMKDDTKYKINKIIWYMNENEILKMKYIKWYVIWNDSNEKWNMMYVK